MAGSAAVGHQWAVAIAARHCNARAALEVNSRGGLPLADGLTWPAPLPGTERRAQFFLLGNYKRLVCQKRLVGRGDEQVGRASGN